MLNPAAARLRAYRDGGLDLTWAEVVRLVGDLSPADRVTVLMEAAPTLEEARSMRQRPDRTSAPS